MDIDPQVFETCSTRLKQETVTVRPPYLAMFDFRVETIYVILLFCNIAGEAETSSPGGEMAAAGTTRRAESKLPRCPGLPRLQALRTRRSCRSAGRSLLSLSAASVEDTVAELRRVTVEPENVQPSGRMRRKSVLPQDQYAIRAGFAHSQGCAASAARASSARRGPREHGRLSVLRRRLLILTAALLANRIVILNSDS